MFRPFRWVATCAVGLCAAQGATALDLGANFTVSADDTGGYGIDADFLVSPTEKLSFRATAGYSTGPDDVGDLAGTVLGAGASLHGDHLGVTLDYDSFDDPTSYRVETFGARAWFDVGDLRFSLLGRQRNMDVTLTLDLPTRVVRREVDFSAVGAGLELSYTHGDFGAYLMALDYEYDDEFERFVAIDDGPLAERRPRIEALLGSFIMQAQGAIDQQAAAGVQYGFGRNAVALDVSTVHDAIIDEHSASYMVSWHRLHSTRMDWSVSAGLIDSMSIGNVACLTVSLGISN
jgi:hypothetical protein